MPAASPPGSRYANPKPRAAPAKSSPSKNVPFAYRPRAPPTASTTTASRITRSTYLPRYRRIPLYLAGVTLFATSAYGVYVYKSFLADTDRALTSPIPLDVSDRYSQNAEHYDSDIDTQEWLMGMGSLRKKLCANATGHVLESAVGTGRNAKYYPLVENKIKSVTMVDPSSEMLRIARLNWPKTNAYFIRAGFRVQSAREAVPSPEEEGFDTVLQTMGVCSEADAVGVLRNLGVMVKPEVGRVLLLEHGRGYYGWVNRLLDRSAPMHADRHGCWYNKDVGEIVRESGLEVVEEKRFHFGTTWWYVLKAPAGFRARYAPRDENKGETFAVQKVEHGVVERPWWARFWR